MMSPLLTGLGTNPMPQAPPHMKTCCAIIISLGLAGCTHVAEQRQQDLAQLHVKTGLDAFPKQATAPTPTGVLTEEQLIRLAIANNKGLRARLSALDISLADMLEATSWPSPTVSIGKMVGNGTSLLSTGIEFDLTGLLWRSARIKTAEQEHRAKIAETADELHRFIMQVRMAIHDWQRTDALLLQSRQLSEAARATAELAEAQFRKGTLSRRDMIRYQLEAASILADSQSAELEAQSAAEALLVLTGESPDTATLRPGKISPPPETLTLPEDAEAYALANRQDLLALELQRQAHLSALSRTRSSLWTGEFGLGAETEKRSGEPRESGPRLSFTLPLIGGGRTGLMREQAAVTQLSAEYEQKTLEIRSETRLALKHLKQEWRRARNLNDTILKLHEQNVEETLKRYNGMLEGAYELIEARRQQLLAQNEALTATARFWLANARLDQALGKPYAAAAQGANPEAKQAAPAGAHQHD